ncbi:NAD(P)/FAD-dependent oxidoreductase [Mycobacterium sp. 236(2023)]|uniref:flavin-containing monooxygenase n=1 Tax=Mycobacterium sp. 236(2023) TaxID=3038163 RepID=UPI002415105C|nr:NAD(P)/FAD-dependent oxidoreductase [Mycobacterium sp. 236(2023)]MDG4662962.1 NAD(P)/FAD-dependent oxidoreductase [Mycobacterium sp. 236(2023)]
MGDNEVLGDVARRLAPDALLGLPFDTPDDAIRTAIAEASVPALLMSMVHMTSDLSLLDELPRPFMLIPMDLQGGMNEADKQTVRDRAFDIVREYRDRGCPPPFIPDAEQMRFMLDVMSAGQVTEDYVDYVAADLRLSDADEAGPRLESTVEQRSTFPVVIIGCGEAGLLAGIKLKQAGIPFTIVDKQDGVGGTWRANRYPGCRVDIANQYYAYSFEPTDHWTHYYSEQPEILGYLEDVMDRHGVATHTRFSTEVTSATWDDAESIWRVAIRPSDGAEEELHARALICAVGQFSTPVIPDIKGAKDFRGPSFHTADWRDEVELTGKKVAVIGAGASGFQLVPAIADRTERVDVYQRTPQWMAPNITYHDPIPDGARWAIRHLPYYGRWLRFLSWWPLTDAAEDRVMVDAGWDTGGLSCGEANHAVREMLIAWMRVFTDDDDLLAKVIPDYPPMGKRMLQDNGTWLTTLQRDDVELIRDGIAEITADGVTTSDGVHRRADILLWATGFDVNHQLGPIDIRGLHGLALNDAWGESPYAYLGITVPDFPNFFCMYGPGTNAVNGASIIYNSECQMRYILGCIDLIIAGQVRRATVRAEVCTDYNRRNQERLKTMVYTHPKVVSYYKNSAGTVPTLYGFRIADYWRWTNRPDPADYEML